jgi:uncharacterized protein (TIGR03435 family)
MKAVILISAMAIAAVYPAAAQDAPPAKPEALEIASVRMNPRGTAGPVSWSPYGGASFTAHNTTLSLLVQLAWGLPDRQLQNADRLGSETYELAVKPASGGAVSWERLKPMLRTLLAERFKLSTHDEAKEVSGYALVLGKGGPRLKASDGAKGNLMILPGSLRGAGITLDDLAGMLASPLGRPVVNRTGIDGQYDVVLEYANEAAGMPTAANDSKPSIFSALQEQLGLKVESTKVSQQILVIDRCNTIPTEN